MRLTPLALLVSLLVVPAAFAAPNASGDGVFELNQVDASRVVITGTRGAIWGQIDSGTLRVTDVNLEDNVAPQVSGAEYTQSTADPGVKLYYGKNIHFRFSGQKYRFTITNATGVDVTAVGVGQVSLTGDPYSFDPGYYAIDGGKWLPVPLVKKLLTFGVQPVVPATP
jgi:hypothetical protein